MHKSCDKNVIVPFAVKWLAGGRQYQNQADLEFFQLGLVQCEILVLLICTCEFTELARVSLLTSPGYYHK